MEDQRISDIIARLTTLEAKPRSIPIDPTANVLGLVAAETKRQDDLRQIEFRRQDDLRDQAEQYQDKISDERRKADSEARVAEARRIDALLAANTNNVALALEKQGAQAQAQDKRIAALEQNQYQGVGATGQRGESRQFNQWVVYIALMIGGYLLAHFWK